MKKAVLQNNHIQYDLLKRYSLKDLAIGVAFSLVSGGLCLLLNDCINGFGKLTEDVMWKWIIRGVIAVAMAVMIGLIAHRIMSMRRIAKERRFTVLRDRLISTTEEADRIGVDYRHVNMKFLRFSSFGEYRIPHIHHYTWSKEFCMTPEGICNTAVNGDEFYIVTADHRTILTVYPAKFFDYRAEAENPFTLS